MKKSSVVVYGLLVWLLWLFVVNSWYVCGSNVLCWLRGFVFFV